MSLVHFPGPSQPNPNPVCSDIALQLVGGRLLTTSDEQSNK